MCICALWIKVIHVIFSGVTYHLLNMYGLLFDLKNLKICLGTRFQKGFVAATHPNAKKALKAKIEGLLNVRNLEVEIVHMKIQE